MKSTLEQLKIILRELKPNETRLVATPEEPTNEKIENYTCLIEIIHDHTDFKYELTSVAEGLKIKRIK